MITDAQREVIVCVGTKFLPPSSELADFVSAGAGV